MIRIGFLALAQAHQHLHWIPGALGLAKRPGVQVDVLCASRANLDFIRGHDPEKLLRLRFLPTPRRSKDGLFSIPKRRLTAILFHPLMLAYDALVTTETSSSVLKRLPWFKVPLIHLKHGAGDAEAGYNPKHRYFDLTMVNGVKDKQRLIDRGLASADQIAVVGYAKFEIEPAPERLFADDRPVALYNAHAKAPDSTWFDHAPAIVAAMEVLPHWNFIVAPHVKATGGQVVTSAARNILIDRGSRRSIDMSYTHAADVYIGDVSSQVYEFIRSPRPCIFLNLGQAEWREREKYSHWHFGEVIEDIAELGAALGRAASLLAGYEPLQRAALARSIDPSSVPSSERQADAILAFIRTRLRG